MATQPWFVSDEVEVAVVTSDTAGVVDPTANGPGRVQVKVGAAYEHVQPLFVKVAPAPRERGPLLFARRTEVRGDPWATGLGDFVLAIDKSAPSRWNVKL